ncbi:MAG: phospho-sugar mutase [Cyclobacteriaceae bacterium]
MSLLELAKSNAQRWLDSPVVDPDTKAQIQSLMQAGDEKPLIDSFYKQLEFGTGGLRGVMGVGSNCMNKYMVGMATQGLANYLKKVHGSKKISVAIAFDSRNNSPFFAQVTADVFSANGIHVYLFDELRPTPLLSFAIRYLQCQSGVVITASHNPKEYNGYKAYWNGGAQVVPPHDQNVIAEVNAIASFEEINFNANRSLIHLVAPAVENAYYEEVIKLIPAKESVHRQAALPMVYSSLHGAGITMVPECLKRIGFTNCSVVEEQRAADGNFPTVDSPNPEEQSAMKMALEQAQQMGARLVMATDPDTDRVGIGIPDENGKFFLLNGNQAFSLMMWFIMKHLKDTGNAYVAKTIVTTELVDIMAEHFGVKCYNTLTGFKYIAELMKKLEGKERFIAAGEESYGYMVGDFVRDKDAVSACAFFAAMAAAAEDKKETLYDWLLQMYVDYGFYKEGLINLVRKGADGEQQIKAMMEGFRNSPPAAIAGEKVIRFLDYKASVEKDLVNGRAVPIDLPKSDVLQFYTDGASKISVRPSGTEPKIKFYVSVKGELKQKSDYEVMNRFLEQRIQKIGQQIAP